MYVDMRMQKESESVETAQADLDGLIHRAEEAGEEPSETEFNTKSQVCALPSLAHFISFHFASPQSSPSSPPLAHTA